MPGERSVKGHLCSRGSNDFCVLKVEEKQGPFLFCFLNVQEEKVSSVVTVQSCVFCGAGGLYWHCPLPLVEEDCIGIVPFFGGLVVCR